MAITSTPAFQGQNMFITDIVASLDADTTLLLTHGLSATPLCWIFTPTVANGAAYAALCPWFITLPTATTVTLNKVATAGTAAGSNARLILWLPHSIIR
jgi:hypothetical protein